MAARVVEDAKAEKPETERMDRTPDPPTPPPAALTIRITGTSHNDLFT
jgi:hypothetical protein